MSTRCRVCKTGTDDLRIIVRDDYDTVQGSFSLPITEVEQNRMSGLLQTLEDRGHDPYSQPECKPCRRKIAAEAAAEAEAFRRNHYGYDD